MQLDLKDKPMARVALVMAKDHHQGIFRKFDNKPYIEHPIEVAEILLAHGVTSQDMLAAALLHDCMEDENLEGVRMTASVVENNCGLKVRRMVQDLSRKPNQRKSNYYAQLGIACHDTKTIKAADMISNMKRLHETPTDFWERQLKKRADGLSALKANAFKDTYGVGATARKTLQEQQIRFLAHLEAHHEDEMELQRLNAAEVDALAAEILREDYDPVFA